MLNLTSSAARNLRAAERGWDWDIFATPEKSSDSTFTIDPDLARAQAQADLARLLKVSRRNTTGKKERSEEE